MMASQLWGVGLLCGFTLYILRQRRGQRIEAMPLLAAAACLGAAGALLWPYLILGHLAGLASMGAILGAGLLWGAIASRARLYHRLAPQLGALLEAGLVTLAVARLGCILDGCHGRAPCWTIVWLLSGWSLTMAALHAILQRRARAPTGVITALIISGYLLGRIGIAPARLRPPGWSMHPDALGAALAWLAWAMIVWRLDRDKVRVEGG